MPRCIDHADDKVQRTELEMNFKYHYYIYNSERLTHFLFFQSLPPSVPGL